MSFNCKENLNMYSEYLTSLVKLNELQKMAEDLEDELADSQQTMKDIRTMTESIMTVQNIGMPVNNVVRQEDLAQFMETGPPQLLMDDMSANTSEVDLDVIISIMKGEAEELRKNYVLTQPQSTGSRRSIENLDLGSYATSLDQLVKRLANVKLNKLDEINKNTELEAKLTQLCKDVNMFTEMVQAKKTLGETNKNMTPAPEDANTLYYDNIINKLLAGINEVTYLLKNKN